MMRCSSNVRSPLHAGHTRIAFSSSSTMTSVLSGSRIDLRAEPLERAPQAILGIDTRLPPEQGPRARDVGLPHLRIILRERLEHELAGAAREADDALREVEQRHLVRVADVHGIRD